MKSQNSHTITQANSVAAISGLDLQSIHTLGTVRLFHYATDFTRFVLIIFLGKIGRCWYHRTVTLAAKEKWQEPGPDESRSPDVHSLLLSPGRVNSVSYLAFRRVIHSDC